MRTVPAAHNLPRMPAHAAAEEPVFPSLRIAKVDARTFVQAVPGSGQSLIASVCETQICFSGRETGQIVSACLVAKKAGFEQTDASIVDIDYASGRKLNKSLINRLASSEYIAEYRNIFITGARSTTNISLLKYRLFLIENLI